MKNIIMLALVLAIRLDMWRGIGYELEDGVFRLQVELELGFLSLSLSTIRSSLFTDWRDVMTYLPYVILRYAVMLFSWVPWLCWAQLPYLYLP